MKSKLMISPSRMKMTALFTSLSTNAKQKPPLTASAQQGLNLDAVVNQFYVSLSEHRLRSLGNGHLNQLDMVIQRKVNCSALVPSELPKYTCYSRVPYFGKVGQSQLQTGM